MKVDTSWLKNTPISGKNGQMAVGKKVGPDEYKFIGVQSGCCKAWLWDYLYFNFNKRNRGLWEVKIPPEHHLTPKDKTVILLWNNTEKRVKLIQDRLKPLEKAFRFKPSLVQYDPKTKMVVVEGSSRWMADVVMFSLFLSTIRHDYGNDEKTYRFAVENIGKVKSYYTNLKGKSDWPEENMVKSHGLGYNNHFQVGY